MEMLFLSLFLIFNSVRPIYICRNTLTREQYYSALIYLISAYMITIFEMCSVVCSLFSSIEFYILISNQKKSKLILFRKYSYKLISLILFIICSVIYSFRLYEFEIVEGRRSVNSTFASNNSSPFINVKYYCNKSSYSNSIYFKIHKLFGSLLLNGVNPIVFIILNVMIFIRVRNSLKQKRLLLKNEIESTMTSTSKQQTDVINSKKVNSKISTKNAENSLNLMFILGNLNTLTTRACILGYFIFDTIYEGSKLTEIICIFAIIIYHILNFLIFYFTNNVIKNVTHNYLKRLIFFKFKK